MDSRQEFLQDFFNAPIDTVVQAYATLRDMGYFNVLFTEFNNPLAMFPPKIIGYYFLFGALIFIMHRASWPQHLTLLEYIFPKRILKRQSFFLDIQWFVLSVLTIIQIATTIVGTAIFLFFVSDYLASIDYSNWYVIKVVREYLSDLPVGFRNILLFFSVLLMQDFFLYWYHRMFHCIPILWHFHKIHHYPRQITFLAAWRNHPLDQALGNFTGKLALVVILALWTPLYSSQDIRGYEQLFETELPVLWAVIAVTRFFHNFNHTTIYIRFGGLLDRVFYSPSLHMVHHSRDIPNKNFAVLFSVWDWLFGTLYVPKNVVEHYNISQRLGVPNMADNYYKSVFHAIVLPFLDCIPIKKRLA